MYIAWKYVMYSKNLVILESSEFHLCLLAAVQHMKPNCEVRLVHVSPDLCKLVSHHPWDTIYIEDMDK